MNVNGGQPLSSTSLPPWPFFDEEEIVAVSSILRSGKVNYWTGEVGRLFEKEFAEFVGVDYAVALMNGTVALEAALYALGIGPDDEVIVTPRTFIASASCAVTRGARPVFADVDHESQNISAGNIEAVLGPRTKAIIAVHLAGWPCDMDSILDVARRHNLKVIEDCAQAHGAIYKGERVGSFGDVAAFSFCQDKIMTTGGEGGMLTTKSHEIWNKVWSYKDHGKSYDAVYNREHAPGFRWLHESFGTNGRMTEMQAAIGRIQLRKLEDWLDIRNQNAAILTECCSRISALRVPIPPDFIRHAYYKYYVFVRKENLRAGWDRDRIIGAIEAEGVPCYSGSCSEIYMERAFDKNGMRPETRLSIARELGETSLMFLVHPTLSQEHLNRVCAVVRSVFERASL